MKELWTPQDELEYQVGFDKPIFKREEPKKPMERPKSPRPTVPIRREKVNHKKHITK